jgi:nucleotide-binding universal stress UspA family protein
MKKILCPIDFSNASLNGLEHAAQWAKILNASLSLLYVRTSIWPEAIQLDREVQESNEDIQARLELLSKSTIDELGVSCHFHFESTTLTFEESAAAHTRLSDLVVMGTNGADNYYQYFFGSNSFHLIEKSKCPVLIIPETYKFRPIQLIVYGYDPDTNPLFRIDQLKKLAHPAGAAVKVLHLGEKNRLEIIHRELEVLSDAITAKTPMAVNWSYHSQNTSDVSMALNQFVKETDADVLALSFHHRSLIEKIFKENTIKKISAIADHPVFVFWH